MTSHNLARQPISCYYYACDLSYFDVVLCSFSSQILATNDQISFSRKPRPLNAHSLRSLGFPKSPALKKILDPPMCSFHWGYNTRFLEPTRGCPPNGTSIGSAVSTGSIHVSNTQPDTDHGTCGMCIACVRCGLTTRNQKAIMQYLYGTHAETD